jgi:hypothetical protein
MSAAESGEMIQGVTVPFVAGRDGRFVCRFGHVAGQRAYALRAPRCRLPIVRLLAVTLASASAALVPISAPASLGPPARMTLEGVAGARPGMSVEAVSGAWELRLRPTYEVRPSCGQAFIDERGLEGYAIFSPRERFGALFLRKGAVTRKGIRIGSTLAQLRRAYATLTSRPDRYVHGGRNYFLRRARPPHWQLRFDVGPGKRVTQIAFGNRESVRLDEGCA